MSSISNHDSAFKTVRIGIGYDVHPFVDERQLYLGGIAIDHHRGLAGHSDADVLIHTILDALLGAAGMPDIGQLFSDKDPAFHNIRSTVLMTEVGRLLAEAGIAIINIDSVVICQEPKIAPHVESMRAVMAQALGLDDPKKIGIRGKTTEHLGFTGRGEGIAVHAVALVDIGAQL